MRSSSGRESFGIFDTFANEASRNAHLTGEIAKALGARANELLAVPPQIEKVEVLASTPLKGWVRGSKSGAKGESHESNSYQH